MANTTKNLFLKSVLLSSKVLKMEEANTPTHKASAVHPTVDGVLTVLP